MLHAFLLIISDLIILHLFGYPERRGVVGWIVVSFYGAGFKIDNPSIGYIGAIWFLLALFWVMIIVRIVGNWKNSLYIIVVISYLGWKTASDFYLPFSLQSGMLAGLLVYLGFPYSSLSEMLSQKSVSGYVILFIVLLIKVLWATIWIVIINRIPLLKSLFLGSGIKLISIRISRT